jgi:phosphatidylcholine synthase
MNNQTFSIPQYILATLVHIFTASGAIIGLACIEYIYQQKPVIALWLMALAVFIDAIDGTIARLAHVKSVLPGFDGALLDNIIDFINYVLVPCLFIIHNYIPLPDYRWLIASLILLSSCYQFCQADAKTPDHFFKGFPSYWNIVVFFLFIIQTTPQMNALILLTLCVLVFVPIKYVYPSRLEALSQYIWLKVLTLTASLLFGVVTLLLLWFYPDKPKLLIAYCYAYMIYYLAISLTKTAIPFLLKKQKY